MQEKQNNLKKQRVFDHVDKAEDEIEAIDPARLFDADSAFVETDTQEEAELNAATAGQVEAYDGFFRTTKRPGHKAWSLLGKLSAMGLLALVVVEAFLGLQSVWFESPWLFALYACVTVVIVAWSGKIAWTEWRKLIELKGVEDAQIQGMRLSQSIQMGEADSFIDNLITQLPANLSLKRYNNAVKPEHNDAEKLILFESLILVERDEVAKKIVRRFAQESAILLAASPLALLDMAIILWRNQRMIHSIAACYGIELGYWSRVKLIRSIIGNIVYAGTSEIVTDLGSQLLSVEMTGKLSARLGQGLGGGLLTARLGYQAMSLCRPLAFTDDARPKLSGIHKELLLDLKELSASVLSKSPQSVKSPQQTKSPQPVANDESSTN